MKHHMLVTLALCGATATFVSTLLAIWQYSDQWGATAFVVGVATIILSCAAGVNKPPAAPALHQPAPAGMLPADTHPEGTT